MFLKINSSKMGDDKKRASWNGGSFTIDKGY